MIDPITLAAARRYTDSQRLAYTSVKRTALLPATELTFTDPMTYDLPFLDIKSGEKYEVCWDETKYELYAGDFQNGEISILGNLSIMDASLDDSGEPFLFASFESEGETMAGIKSGDADVHTASITEIKETIKKIDTKYLPNTSTGVVEINLEDYGVRVPACGVATYQDVDLYNVLADAINNKKEVYAEFKIDKTAFLGYACFGLGERFIIEDGLAYMNGYGYMYGSNLNNIGVVSIAAMKNGSSYTVKVTGLPETLQRLMALEKRTETTYTGELTNCQELHFSSPMTSLNITGFSLPAADVGMVSEYSIVFTAGSGCTVTMPDGVVWSPAQPTWVEGNTYWVKIRPIGDRYLAQCVEIPAES